MIWLNYRRNDRAQILLYAVVSVVAAHLEPVLKNRVPQEIEDAIFALAIEPPAGPLPTSCANRRERALYPPHLWASNFPQF